MTTPTTTRTAPAKDPFTRRPVKPEGGQEVSRGGWFIVEDVNGESIVVRLPGRVEIGA